MDERIIKKYNILTLALGIAFMPPIWAVLAPYIGITTGSVALICAGVYVTNGNKRQDAFKILSGFIMGDLWAVIALWIMEKATLNPNVELYFTLFIMGGIAVIVGETFHRYIFTPAWLCGWAIGLTILGPLNTASFGTLPVQIGVAMAVGILYVGVGVDAFQKVVLDRLMNDKDK